MSSTKKEVIRGKAKVQVSKMNETVNNAAEAGNDATELIVTKGVERGLSLKDTFNQLKHTKLKWSKQ